jgi:hypothetical protein
VILVVLLLLAFGILGMEADGVGAYPSQQGAVEVFDFPQNTLNLSLAEVNVV